MFMDQYTELWNALDLIAERIGKENVLRSPVEMLSYGFDADFQVESYLRHQGTSFVDRFDANSYLVIGKAMDLHDVARGRGSLESAMARIRVPNLTIGPPVVASLRPETDLFEGVEVDR